VSPLGARRALLVAAPFLALALLTKLPSLSFEHREPDEMIYWTVARHLHEHGRYTLRGAPFMQRLPRAMYDRPLFHHPPLYPALLVPFVAHDARREAVAISVLGHLLAIFSVAWIGLHLHARLGGGGSALGALAIPLAGVALDPVLVHTTRKLWIDALVSGLGALAIALTVDAVARATRRRLWLAAAGFTLGLAGLAKLPGLLVAPICALLVVAAPRAWRERVVDLCCLALPALLVVAPWLAVFFATYGSLLPSWSAPNAELLARFPMMAAAVAKPWHFFATKLAVVQPLFPLGVAAFAWSASRGEQRDALGWALLAWLALLLAAFTYLGATRFSFQMRYVAPLCAAIYLVPLALPAWYRAPGAWRLRVGAALAIVWAALGAAPYLMNGRPDEFVGLAETLGLVQF
jgi:4-amino-4-deoxy-L-arabinose transferase-like glycosyltransferase